MYGRITHLNPMKWVNDWPVIGEDKDGDGCGEPVRRYKKPNVGRTYSVETPAESDEFNSRELGLQWEWHANYQDFYGFTSDLGYMRIYGHVLSKDFVNFWEVPNLLLQKFPAEEFTATTKLKVVAKADGQQSGLIVMGWDYCYIGIEKEGEQFVLKQVVCKDAEQKNPEVITRIAELPLNRKFEAGLFPNYERDIYLQVKVGKKVFATSSIAWTERNTKRQENLSSPVKVNGSVLKLACSVQLRSVKKEVGWMPTGFTLKNKRTYDMKTKTLLVGLGICLLAACSGSKGELNVDKALDYCDAQVHRTLTEMKVGNGSIEYTLMPVISWIPYYLHCESNQG